MIVGFFVTNTIKDTKLYHYIEESTISKTPNFYKFLGVGLIKNLIIKTPLKIFNTEIVVKKSKLNFKELNDLKLKMNNAKIGHIVGFVVVIIASLVLCILNNQNKNAIIILNILNIIFNFYPILIQEQNTLRINEIIKHFHN